jgi:vacuolar-type H+-ATPase subunit B/Vma2
MKNSFVTSSYAARLIEHACRFRGETAKVQVSTNTVALILAQPGKPILHKVNVASAGDCVCTFCPHLNPRAYPQFALLSELLNPT